MTILDKTQKFDGEQQRDPQIAASSRG